MYFTTVLLSVLDTLVAMAWCSRSWGGILDTGRVFCGMPQDCQREIAATGLARPGCGEKEFIRWSQSSWSLAEPCPFTRRV